MSYIESPAERRATESGFPYGQGKGYSRQDLKALFDAVYGPEPKQEPLPIETELYTSGWIAGHGCNLPTIETAKEIADLFRRNYPPMSTAASIIHDFPRYRQGEQIIEQINDGNAWLVARTEANGPITAALKFRRENRSKDPQREEILFFLDFSGR